jgi:hypothetical protein
MSGDALFSFVSFSALRTFVRFFYAVRIEVSLQFTRKTSSVVALRTFVSVVFMMLQKMALEIARSLVRFSADIAFVSCDRVVEFSFVVGIVDVQVVIRKDGTLVAFVVQFGYGTLPVAVVLRVRPV